MLEEHMMILKMLEEGKITSEEAAALIEALNEAVEPGEGAPGEGGEARQGLDQEASGQAGQPDGQRMSATAPGEGSNDGATRAWAGAGAGAGAGAAAGAWRAAAREGSDVSGGAGEGSEIFGYGPDLARLRALADRLAHLAETSYGPALESLAERIEKTVEVAMREKERALERAMREKERAAEKLGEELSGKTRWRSRWGEPPDWVEAFTEPFLSVLAPGVRVERTFEGTFDAQLEKVSVEATTSNGGITIDPWDGPGFRVEVRARVRGAASDPGVARARLEEAIEYEAAPDRLRIDCSGENVVSGAALAIQLPRGFRYDLDLETSNGKVEIGALDCGTIDVETSNGRITLDGASVVTAELETANGRIQCRGPAKRLVAETSNGSILVAPARPAGDAVYELETSNGSIEVQLATAEDVGYSIEAETSHGGIHVDLPNLRYEVNTRSMGHKEIVASTTGYETNANKLRIKAETSNGSITITGAGPNAAGQSRPHSPGEPGTPSMPDAPGTPGTPGTPGAPEPGA
ncbi:MAG: DUF4097 family beta strand repeat-containing protein [Bacillota bacterium]|nr:DUF4097 family beta strand repeat-containing protein [Bacillota bacterium]